MTPSATLTGNFAVMHHYSSHAMMVGSSSPSEGSPMRRRDCIALLGSAAAAWPLAAQAQQAKTPVVGYLGIASREDAPDWFAGLRKGLQESGFIEGQNINIEYRST